MRGVWTALFAGCALVSPGCNRTGPPAARHANVRVLGSSCAAAWPALIRVIEEAGFRLVAKDDNGRIATFMWLGSQLPVGLETAQHVAMGPDGSGWSNNIRVESAVLALSPQRRGCEAKISVSYQGRKGAWGDRWSKVESTGLLESRFLTALRLPPPVSGRRSAAANGGSPAPEPTRTARLPGLAAGMAMADTEGATSDGRHTAVYTLGRH